MPIHDWTRVLAGIFHHFHQSWITQISLALNGGLLPDDYYSMAEQVAGRTVPDVLTLENVAGPLAEQGFDVAPDEGDDEGDSGGVAVLTAPPRVRVVEQLPEAMLLTLKRNRLSIRHATDDRVVALLEIVSPGNKSGQRPMDMLARKSIAALQRGLHLVVLDLLPPGPFDPRGLHDRLWTDLGGEPFTPPPDRPLTLAGYRAAGDITAYVEPTAVGLEPVDVPLFFTPDRYVNVPLADTYAAAYQGVPKRWRRVIEGDAP